MTTVLGDVLLVLLSDRPASAHDLHQRHLNVLGLRQQVDIRRVGATLTRQERLGYVGTDQVLSRGLRRVWALTGPGRRRQRSWILDVEQDGTEDVVVRALLAVEVTDRETFEAVIRSGVAALERRHLRTAAPRSAFLSAADARGELDAVTATAVIEWLHGLRDRVRERDRDT